MKLGLGTAQFGLDYGVSNREGQTAPDEAAGILALAARSGINVVDTASMYGSSEAVLGSILPSIKLPFDIVTKTPRFGGSLLASADAAHLEKLFYQSLSALQTSSVYGLMFHHADDLLSEGASVLVEKVCDLKRQGLVRKWGFSAYTGTQVDAILERYTPDIVQVPVNVLDQRLIQGGQLERLKHAGVEIHCRSAFLQGLLLMDPAELNQYFAPFEQLLKAYRRETDERGISPLRSALGFVLNLCEIDRVIVGVCSCQELQQIIDASHAIEDCSIDYGKFASNDDNLVNPARWKLQ